MRIPISREDAHSQGLKRYYTGEPCKRGHTCERFTCNTGCVMCMNWASPKRKLAGPQGRNVGWPKVGLVFRSSDLLPEEAHAAFRYIEENGWHDAAVLAIRKDPTLLAKYTTPLTLKEQADLNTRLETDRRVRARLRGEE